MPALPAGYMQRRKWASRRRTQAAASDGTMLTFCAGQGQLQTRPESGGISPALPRVPVSLAQVNAQVNSDGPKRILRGRQSLDIFIRSVPHP